MSNELLFFLSTLGWFNGLILALYFLFFYKNRKLSGILFGLMLLSLSIRVAKSVLWWFYPKLPLLIILTGLVACLFVGPLLYYYIKSSVEGIKEMPRKWKITLAGYGVLAVILLVFFSSQNDIPVWRDYFIPGIYFLWLTYVVISGFPLQSLFKKSVTADQVLKPNEKWILGVYTSSLLIAVTYMLAFFDIRLYYISGPISFSLLLYLNVMILLYRKKTSDLFQSTPEKYANKKINTEQAAAKIQELELLMKEKQIFTDPELKLNQLAEHLQLSGHQLSQLLNDNLGKSFNAYINDCRIQRACEIIAEDHTLKLEAVGYDVGFNSKSAFFAAFKKTTGTTPKQYKEQLS